VDAELADKSPDLHSPAAQEKPKVALVGLGSMGSAIAERILEAHYPLSVYNRSPGRDRGLVERGASKLESLGGALADADVCLMSLADDEAIEDVALGKASVFARAERGAVLVDMSTISVTASRRVAKAADDAGVHYVRAPLSGNPVAVRTGKATVIVSGSEAIARRCEPLLSSIAPTFRYVGEGERARVLKLVLQVLIGGTAELLAEALVLGEAAGVDRRTLLEVIRASVVGSAFVDYKTEPLLRDDYSATFTTAMMEKDVDLVLDLADELEVGLPLTRELRSLLEAASESGHADQDFMSLVLLLRERAADAQPANRKR
jgi:3-hydroxyisobutyrate dehydrogenase-like beta-hydroxyacid dehydrogenase